MITALERRRMLDAGVNLNVAIGVLLDILNRIDGIIVDRGCGGLCP